MKSACAVTEIVLEKITGWVAVALFSVEVSQQGVTEMTRQLTPRQAQVVQLVRDFVHSRGYPPTLAEIATSLNVTASAVAGHLAAAQRKGVLRRDAGVARGISFNSTGAA